MIGGKLSGVKLIHIAEESGQLKNTELLSFEEWQSHASLPGVLRVHLN
jgi:hypothetical protein